MTEKEVSHATTPKVLDNDVNILVLNGVFEHDALELIEYNLTPCSK